MRRILISSLTVLALIAWHHAVGADISAPKIDRIKQAEDLVPEASQKDEFAAKEALRYLLHSHTIPLSVN